MITNFDERTFKPAHGYDVKAFEAAELDAQTLDARLALPDGFSIYACPARFYSWAEPVSREWFQLHVPSGGETTLDASELLKRYPLDSASGISTLPEDV